jgi:glutathione S-transferase
MLTLIHAPLSRSSRIVTLIDEMGIKDWVKVEPVTIVRTDGSGTPDTTNPHPEGKVPLLIHDGTVIRESGAIIQYLTDMFPDAGLGRPVGHAQRGEYISWLYWYGSVMEPVLIFEALGLANPRLRARFGGWRS